MKLLAATALVVGLMVGLMFGQREDLPAPAPGANAVVPPPSRATIATRVDPEYSTDARAAKLEGVVTVYYEVDTDGRPRAVNTVRGLGMGLDEKAADAVKKWRFNPPPAISMESVDLYFKLGAPGGWGVRHTAFTVIEQGPRDNHIERPVLSHYTQPTSPGCPDAERTVVTSFHIDKKGVPSEVHAGSTPASTAIRDAVQTWRFKPARSNGSARAADAVFTLVCNLGPAAVTPPWRAGSGVSTPKIVSSVEPEYSDTARKAKASGTVQLQLTVDADGFATNIQVLRPLGLGLDEKSVGAVAQWRFTPGRLDGKPVPVFATILTTFRLL